MYVGQNKLCFFYTVLTTYTIELLKGMEVSSVKEIKNRYGV